MDVLRWSPAYESNVRKAFPKASAALDDLLAAGIVVAEREATAEAIIRLRRRGDPRVQGRMPE